jgi:iron complex transport system substrate-binding protein
MTTATRLLTVVAGAVILFGIVTGSDARETRVIADMAGRNVTIPVKVERVATIGSVPVINSFVFAAGAGGMIVNGLPDFARRPRWKYQSVFAPSLADKIMMQGPDRSPEVEKLLQAAPDVVFSMDRPAVDQMAARGLPAVFLSWREPEDAKLAMILVADILGVPQVGSHYASYFDGTIQRVARQVEAARATRPKVLYLAAASMQQPHLIPEWWIKAAGGISVTDDGRNVEARALTIEQILDWNPDVLILNAPGDLAIVNKDPRFSHIKAVVNKRVHLAPMGAHTWGNRTIENPLTVLWAAKMFHPATFADLDLVKEVKGFYETFFKTTLTDAQVEEILAGRL